MWAIVLNLLGWLVAIIIGGAILVISFCIIGLICCFISVAPELKEFMKEEMKNECSSSKENRQED